VNKAALFFSKNRALCREFAVHTLKKHKNCAKPQQNRKKGLTKQFYPYIIGGSKIFCKEYDSALWKKA
jgi:hypothetical protein